MVRDPEHAVQWEWLEANGLGDFACGTVAGPLIRRQHGLFTLGEGPGRRPMLLLATTDETLETPAGPFPLSCQQYATARAPLGYENLAAFSASPFPEWRYEFPGITLTRSLIFPKGRRAIILSWTLSPDAPQGEYRLRVRPLFAYRDADALTSQNSTVNMALSQQDDTLRLAPYPGCPEFILRHSDAKFFHSPCWYYKFQHPHDLAAGRNAQEDFFSPCEYSFPLSPGATVHLVGGTEFLPGSASEAVLAERARRQALTLFDIEKDAIAPLLARAADAFAVNESGLITAFPDRATNLRAALIALPGVLLCNRKFVHARNFLRRAALELKNAPNLGDEPLWLARAGELYVDHSRDWDFLRDELTPLCDDLARRYRESDATTSFRIAPDGLLYTESEYPLTWMNAVNDQWTATPRRGKPVEVNALWSHMLALLSRWWGRRNELDKARNCASLRELCARSFRNRFWNEADHCLHDAVDSPDEISSAIRPNQIIAVALPGDLLDRQQAMGVLSVIEKRLLTPRGLRTLALEHPSFLPRTGPTPDGTAMRFQGPAYPWLIGAYIDAIFRVHGRISRAYARAESCLNAFLQEHLREACMGHISEYFDGASPHTPRGNFADAAALGEIIRAYLEVNGRIW